MSKITLGTIYYPDESKDNDFIGFTFNNIHSSELGIIRVSEGSRYQESLLPTMTDQVVQVPGGDGSYFFGTHYAQKSFPISFAFDSLTEENFRKIKQWLDGKEIGKLTFDETPYKSYSVKVGEGSNIQYICFEKIEIETVTDENNQTISIEKRVRVYKGEGTIQFIAYFPFGICDKKYLDLYTDSNKNEWSRASKLLLSQYVIDNGQKIPVYDQPNNTQINLYNPGDFKTDFQAYYKFTDNALVLKSISITESADTLGILILSGNITKKNNDTYLRIDSETELIEGCDENKKPTGNLYNEYIVGGSFFKIPIIDDETRTVTFKSDGSNCTQLDYSYLYY